MNKFVSLSNHRVSAKQVHITIALAVVIVQHRVAAGDWLVGSLVGSLCTMNK